MPYFCGTCGQAVFGKVCTSCATLDKRQREIDLLRKALTCCLQNRFCPTCGREWRRDGHGLDCIIEQALGANLD